LGPPLPNLTKKYAVGLEISCPARRL
jgi:hypothetical protein